MREAARRREAMRGAQICVAAPHSTKRQVASRAGSAYFTSRDVPRRITLLPIGHLTSLLDLAEL
jgi:hypothetical protein